jgi:HAMP domain-containing protein
MAKKYPNRRRTFLLLLSPRFQMKYGLYYAGIAVTSLLTLNVLAAFLLVQLIDYSGSAKMSAGITEILFTTLKANAPFVALGCGILGLLYLCFAIFLTRNVVGPSRALLRHIDALKTGQYTHKTTLRKNDELKEIMTALNELSDVLQERHGQIIRDEKAG